jgi:hypothetical protein
VGSGVGKCTTSESVHGGHFLDEINSAIIFESPLHIGLKRGRKYT